ncbi:TetR/AcrR family transcriptional regulator [Sphingobacterium haloxyli]|uniref:HTH tetR-type domain-containing protein n=1 Tax=Sphingobacterium haloxyli TaxID=2100533 RepID=A0A2S9J6R6_9SPHI|nr:TetR/AcrR family transcriptional regulator [Sphingobacterium haloxyli]PRD48462.1 hypothetical protein C5745_04460 [Sphingobacterium haloxyli]
MTNKQRTEDQLVEQTIQILSEEGIGGLTMRKVASNCGVRLSNLQYYYPNRTALVQAAVKRFFLRCEEVLIAERKSMADIGSSSPRDFLRMLIDKMIVCDPEDQYGIVFREAWALAAHDKELAETLREYYRTYINWMIALVADDVVEAEKVMCILIPYAEGYSLMGDTLPFPREVIVEMLLNIIDVA